jgi:hypothetical protein
MEVSGQLHAPAALPLEKEILVPTGWKALWDQSRSERGSMEQRIIYKMCCFKSHLI